MESFEAINHLLDLPEFTKLKSFNETTNVLKSLLGKSKSALVKFAYERENNGEFTLFIVVAHPMALQELKHDSNIFLIKSLLKKYALFNPNSRVKSPNFIKFLVAKTFDTKTINFMEFTPQKFIEKSKGEFENRAKDERIHALFERLRETIKKCSKTN